MDNIIKIILRQSGGLAEMVKTIPLYVGMYNTAILNVYVPQSLVSDGISVKVGAILTANDGTKATTDSLPMTYKGEETFCNEEYSVYELNPFPANFLTYAGQQDLVVNIVTIENEEVASVVTTQICKVDVLDSALIPDEEMEASVVDLFNARITANEQNIATNTENIDANTQQIDQNVLDIAQNTQDIEDIKENYTTNENPVGNLIVTTLTGIETHLNQLVQQVEGRNPEKGDVVMVTLQITGQTDEIYKYFYTASGWRYLQMPALESASNTDKGIIQGTLGENKNTQVDITGGKINAVYVKDNNGVLRDIREYANTTKTSIDNIISGVTKVGHSVKADQDQNGNEITSTYLTQNAGVTKTQMRDYALPREFNDIYYLARGSENYAEFVDTKPSESITYVSTISTIGTYPLIVAPYISSAEFELSSKNSYQATFYISASMNTTKQFRLHIYSGLTDFCTEFSNEISMVANNVYKIQFNGNFTELDEVYKYNGSNSITVVLSVVSTDTDNVTYTIYQNATYTSSFNLNTNKYTINVAQGELGEIPSIVVDGYEVESGTITFEMYDNTNFLKNNTLASFKLSYSGTSLDKYLKLAFEFGSQSEEYHLQTPYNGTAITDRPKASDFTQTRVTISGGIVTIEFIGLIKVVENYGTVIYVDMDNLTAFGGTTVYVNNVAQAIVNFNSDPQTQISANAQNITSLGTRVGTAETDIDNIEAKIPTEASSSNKLADKDYVNNAVNQFSAYYITKNAQGEPFSTKAELNNATVFYSGGVVRVPTTNDYCIVLADESKQSSTGVDPTTRYSYQGNQWEYQYTINDTPLTAAQLAALNSGITSNLVSQIGTNTTNIANKMDKADPTGTGSLSVNRNTNSTIGRNSVAIGDWNIASGAYSTATGSFNTASGYCSAAGGFETVASGSYSSAINRDTVAAGNNQFAFGKYNVADSQHKYVEIVGNGTADNARSNARTLDWNGNEVLAGTSQATGFKTASGTGNKLFADNGTAIEYQSSQTDSANKIVQRDANRDVLVPSTPTSNNGATSKSYVDGKTVPTAWQSATVNTNTVEQGICEYCSIGNLVIVNVDNLVVKSGVDGKGTNTVLFSGLPKPNKYLIYLIPGFFTNVWTTIRTAIKPLTNDGEMVLHWSADQSFGDTGNQHNLVFVYPKA